MAPIEIKEVVRVSSEDKRWPASNLIHGNKWLTAEGDRSGTATIEVLLQSAVQIEYFDIGYSNVSTLEVKVSKSGSYCDSVTLLPKVVLQNCMDSKMGRNITGCKMYKLSDHFERDVGSQQWDKVQLILCQPYSTNKKMGLEFIRFGMTKSSEKSIAANKVESAEDRQMARLNFFQNSPLAKMIQQGDGNDDEVKKKWSKITSSIDGNHGGQSGLSRSAKMVIASQGKSPKSNSAGSKTGNDVRGKLGMQKISPTQLRQTIAMKHNSSSQGKETKNSTRNQTKPPTQKSNANSPGYANNKLYTNCENPAKDTTCRQSSCDKTTNDNNSGTTYTDKQIKKLRKAIKNFFTKLDPTDPNMHKLTVKDLLRKFEASAGACLLEDGRNYFTKVGAKYLAMLLNTSDDAVGSSSGSTTSIKRKSSEMTLSRGERFQSPSKVKRLEDTRLNIHKVECPICHSMFSGSDIELHASSCGENSNIHTMESTSTVVDCSENSCLSKEEQQNWIRYSKKPKPYQKRLNNSDFENTLLAKCPTCGQKYKVSEIEEHSDECADKVFSGSTRMGLYLVQNQKKGRPKKPSNLHSPIFID